MQSALHVKTKILPGNRIEIQLPDLEEGKIVDVFVILPTEVLITSSTEQVNLLKQMAEDPEIQAELSIIDTESSNTQTNRVESAVRYCLGL